MHFRNEALRGQLKVCKALGAGSADLVGQTFELQPHDVSDPDNPCSLGGHASPPGRQRSARSSASCRSARPMKVDEVFAPEDNPDTTQVDESGAVHRRERPGQITILPGVNTATITNTAQGLLEVCKARIEGRASDQAHASRWPIRSSRRSSSRSTAVRSSPSRRASARRRSAVSVGSHTVTEVNEDDYELDSGRSGRRHHRLPGRPRGQPQPRDPHGHRLGALRDERRDARHLLQPRQARAWSRSAS